MIFLLVSAAAVSVAAAQEPEGRPQLLGEADSTGMATAAIDDVTITAKRPALRIDEGRMVYDLERVAEGKPVANVWEALTRLPGVVERDGSLELTGAGGVAVILDGKPSTMDAAQLETLLRTMPVERIASVEVVYSAPPQYGVRGAAINLVLRRHYDRAFAGELHADYANRYYGSGGAGGSLFFQSSAWTTDLSYAFERSKSMQAVDLASHHTLDGSLYEIRQQQRIAKSADTHSLRAGVTWAPAGRGRLSAAYTAFFTPANSGRSVSAGDFVRSTSLPEGDDAMHNAALRYTAAWGLDVSLDYTSYRSSRTAAMSNDYADGTQTRFDVVSGQRIDRLALDIDRERQAGGWQLSYGGSFDWTRDGESQHYTVIEGEVAAGDTDSSADERVGELYVGAGRQFARGGISFSLTGEYYTLGDYRRTALYPQATLLWMPADDHLAQLTLSSDKQYPSFWAMQQAVSYLDGYAEICGTPGLRPMRSYNLQALYMYRRKYIFLLFWSEMPDYFEQAAWQASDRLALVYQTLNWDVNRQWGAMTVVPVEAGRWDARITLSGLRQHQRCDAFHDMSFDRTKWVGMVRMENTLRLCEKPALSLELSAFYSTPVIQATYDTDPIWSVDVGAKCSFAGGRATLTLRATDLFQHGDPDAKVRYGGQSMDIASGFYARRVSANFSWRFGRYGERESREPRKVDTSRFGHDNRQ